MKTIIRYCRHCKKETPHDIKTGDFTGFSRVFMAAVSLGISEAVRSEYYECQVCGKQTKK